MNPVTGRHELMLLSESDEIRIGKETDKKIIEEYGIYRGNRLDEYLNDICKNLVRFSHRPQLQYSIKIIDSPVVNAFAVPGGFLYFSRGILAVINNEAELVSVMGHEIGHVAARHSAQQYSKAQLAQLGLGVGSIFLNSQVVSNIAQLGVKMLFLKFSRDNEREADDLGVEYASKAGYDARQMANFFERLEKMNPGTNRSGLPEWFSTHPSPENRVRSVREGAKKWQALLGFKEVKINQGKYLRMIDGLIYGDDPRQGYVLDNVFYHPLLRFQFPVPKRWKLINTPSKVQIINEAKDGIIVFYILQGHSPKQSAMDFISKTGASVVKAERVSVNVFPSYQLISDHTTEQGLIRVLSIFIEKDRRIYTFHGLSPLLRFRNYASIFSHIMNSFKELKDPNKIDVKPDRIRIFETNKKDSIKNILISLGISNKMLKELALLNGRELDEVVPSNTLIKLIEKGS